MSFINYASKELHCKVIYYGAGLSGKTTNLQYIYDSLNADSKSKLMSLNQENERTLFFDFLPLGVGEVRGYQTRFHLYTVPGQTFYEVSRDLILKGVDGIVFVVDSLEERMEANLESWEQLEKSLSRQGYDIRKLPLVLQYNKRDISGVVTTRELEATFNPHKRPAFEAIASRGIGVMETLKEVCQGIMSDLKGQNN